MSKVSGMSSCKSFALFAHVQGKGLATEKNPSWKDSNGVGADVLHTACMSGEQKPVCLSQMGSPGPRDWLKICWH